MFLKPVVYKKNNKKYYEAHKNIPGMEGCMMGLMGDTMLLPTLPAPPIPLPPTEPRGGDVKPKFLLSVILRSSSRIPVNKEV